MCVTHPTYGMDSNNLRAYLVSRASGVEVTYRQSCAPTHLNRHGLRRTTWSLHLCNSIYIVGISVRMVRFFITGPNWPSAIYMKEPLMGAWSTELSWLQFVFVREEIVHLLETLLITLYFCKTRPTMALYHELRRVFNKTGSVGEKTEWEVCSVLCLCFFR